MYKRYDNNSYSNTNRHLHNTSKNCNYSNQTNKSRNTLNSLNNTADRFSFDTSSAKDTSPYFDNDLHNNNLHDKNYSNKRSSSNRNTNNKEDINEDKPQKNKSTLGVLSSLMGFIPTSLYNPDTGKILGIISPEELLIAALILLLLDNTINNKESDCPDSCTDNDNGMLILALLYLLLSDRIDLPF